MAGAIAGMLCLATGFLMVALGLWRGNLGRSDLLLRISLAAGFGLAIFSIVYFLARLSGFLFLWRIDCAVGAVLVFSWVLFRRSSAAPVPDSDVEKHQSARLLMVGGVIACVAAIYSAVLFAFGRPYGSGWDSFAIWNLHARFLYRGGLHWRDGFSALIPWSHPDYPLLLPAAIAHFWTVLGRETPAVPVVLGLTFTFSTVGLLFSGLDLLASRTCALLGAMALLCTPFFIDLGTWQYADVPLSFYILATFVLLHLHDGLAGAEIRGTLALAGVAAGFAAWTKNEGVLFLCAVLLTRMWLSARQSSPGKGPLFQIAPMLLALAPIFALVLYFKHSIAPPGDLFSDAATMLHKLRDPSRYWAVIKWYGKELFRFGHWLLIPIPIVMLVLYFILKSKIVKRAKPSVQASGVALGMTLAGYFLIYLITPHDIYWHLRFSLSRLLIQVWPSAIFLFFVGVGSEPFEMEVSGS